MMALCNCKMFVEVTSETINARKSYETIAKQLARFSFRFFLFFFSFSQLLELISIHFSDKRSGAICSTISRFLTFAFTFSLSRNSKSALSNAEIRKFFEVGRFHERMALEKEGKCSSPQISDYYFFCTMKRFLSFCSIAIKYKNISCQYFFSFRFFSGKI